MVLKKIRVHTRGVGFVAHFVARFRRFSAGWSRDTD